MEDQPEEFAVPIDGVLDLHTFQPCDCTSLVPEYLRACRERNILRVRIIHGKGRGVLRSIVCSLLDRDPCVIRHYPAPAEAGGWGATIAELNPSRP